MVKKGKFIALLLSIPLLMGCGSKVLENPSENMDKNTVNENVLVYGSGDYTSINPALF